MKLRILLLTALTFLLGCATTQINKEEAKKIRKVAIVGFTMDYKMSFKENLKSALMGNENTMGGNLQTKSTARVFDRKLAKLSYKSLAKELQSVGWDVLSYDRTQRSPTLKAYYNKKVKIGFMPLNRGFERIEANGIPQYHNIQSLKKTPQLEAIAKELGVDTLIFAYATSGWACMSVPVKGCVNTPKYFTSMVVKAYNPSSKQTVFTVSEKGPKIKATDDIKYGLKKREYAMLMGNSVASKQMASKIKTKMD